MIAIYHNGQCPTVPRATVYVILVFSPKIREQERNNSNVQLSILIVI